MRSPGRALSRKANVACDDPHSYVSNLMYIDLAMCCDILTVHTPARGGPDGALLAVPSAQVKDNLFAC